MANRSSEYASVNDVMPSSPDAVYATADEVLVVNYSGVGSLMPQYQSMDDLKGDIVYDSKGILDDIDGGDDDGDASSALTSDS